MGGCRCTFRECENSTQTRPGIHFFHYPVKNKERCKKWIDLANKPTFAMMDAAKLRNRNVCEEHFKMEMFMNYKKERLIRTAYPSLLKTKSGKIYDLEKMMNDKINIENFTIESDLSQGAEYYSYEVPDVSTDQELSNYRIDSICSLDNSSAEGQFVVSNNRSTNTVEIQEDVEVKIIPVDCKQETAIVFETVDSSDDDGNKRKLPEPPTSSNLTILTPVPRKKFKLDCVIPKQPKILLNSTNPIKSPTVSSLKIQQLPILSSAKVKELEKELQIKAENEIKLQNISKSQQTKIKELEAQLDSLKQKLIKSEIKPVTLTVGTQTDAMSTSTTVQGRKSDPATHASKSANLTKPQLFNGIKRYLSNAMATLLKMEMFGSSDREWKQDEKQISCEIMHLGKNVYDYLIDEWRLRLPAKTEVNQWLQENTLDDDEDLY